MHGTITKFKASGSKVRTVRTSVSATRKRTRQRYAAVAVGFVALVLTALSLDHLAHGVAIITRAMTWREWAVAIGLDCLFLSLEAAELLAMSEYVRRQVMKYTRPTIISTICASCMFNAAAFIEPVWMTWLMVPAAVLGVSIPVLIYFAMRVSGTLTLTANKK